MMLQAKEHSAWKPFGLHIVQISGGFAHPYKLFWIEKVPKGT